MRASFIKTLLAVAVGLSFTGAAVAADPAKKNIVIGTTVGDFGDMVKLNIKPQLEKQGYSVKLVEFTDYVRPNLGLAEGSLDVNVFQHKPYLDSFSKEHKLSLTPVFQVPTAPLGVYPGKLKALKDVKAGSTIATPNDPSNFARALVMLADLGWIKLKPGVNPLTASERDIAQNVKQVKIVQLEAAQLPRARGDVDFAIINGNYATSSGIKLTEAVFQEKSYAYVNWGVVKSADAAKPWAKDVIAAYNSPAFKAWAQKQYPGYKLPQNWK
ncbi:MetQ/NlpA family ABC transporter substrate-binding protein [Craterilacuibacter sp. RT1T]|uniref:MetQ/NlpA family ABC transporter substrate-binding protein n=1 Tax=Craterilacuibacter sp. RT1T TaxID=2942211 RepID=UPI0020C0D38E|nr:MetQ/NlpA family ABC transporter substrate-binding protein [Craterilacuibacter sp. RT1T]MCL6262396.1 MetQ/NlpA family ABC transporter substrate-binding protein [Craterilacuibacter sp. RT1T]